MPAGKCSRALKPDLNLDGRIDQQDYALFLAVGYSGGTQPPTGGVTPRTASGTTSTRAISRRDLFIGSQIIEADKSSPSISFSVDDPDTAVETRGVGLNTLLVSVRSFYR